MPGFPLARGSAWAGERDHTPSRVLQRWVPGPPAVERQLHSLTIRPAPPFWGTRGYRGWRHTHTHSPARLVERRHAVAVGRVRSVGPPPFSHTRGTHTRGTHTRGTQCMDTHTLSHLRGWWSGGTRSPSAECGRWARLPSPQWGVRSRTTPAPRPVEPIRDTWEGGNGVNRRLSKKSLLWDTYVQAEPIAHSSKR
jgi:hypothetical protein